MPGSGVHGNWYALMFARKAKLIGDTDHCRIVTHVCTGAARIRIRHIRIIKIHTIGKSPGLRRRCPAAAGLARRSLASMGALGRTWREARRRLATVALSLKEVSLVYL
jgi:hypothetical protein